MLPRLKALRPPRWLYDLWHLPDQLSWMDPLPAGHRRGIIAAVLIILLAFLWPSPTYHSLPPTAIAAQSGAQRTEIPLQADIVDNTAASTQPDARGEWRSYTITDGQTLAQLFRDNNLPVNDIFAMAQVEGSDKPLSALQAGQRVKILQNAQGVVTRLMLESANGNILFTRQPDGTFIKAQ